MRMLNGCLCNILTVFYFVELIYSVPPDYCLHPLNISDCNSKPTPVFSYYKPGSRCEIETWRGCPTLNKFDNEYECTHYCIFRFNKSGDNWTGADNNTDDSMTETPDDLEPNTIAACNEILNTHICNESIDIKVYTYAEDSCKEVRWHGCDGNNKFLNLQTCLTVCSSEDTVNVQKLSTKHCTHIETKVFTYAEGNCSEVSWKGCEENYRFQDLNTCLINRDNMESVCNEEQNSEICTENKTKNYADIDGCKEVADQECDVNSIFPDFEMCLEVCGNASMTKWENDLKKLTEEQVGAIDEILDEVINSVEQPKQTLKYKEENIIPEVEDTTQTVANETENYEEEEQQETDIGEASEVLITRQKNKEAEGAQISE